MANSINAQYTKSSKYNCLEHLKSNYVDLYVNYCGSEQCEPSHLYGPAIRKEYLIHYIIRGKGTFDFKDKSYKLSKGDSFLIMPDEVVSYQADKDDPWEYVWVGFNGVKALNALKYTGFSKENRINHFPNAEPIIKYINKMLGAHQLTLSDDFKRQGYLYLLLATMIEQHKENLSNEETPDYPKGVYVEYATTYIEQNYSKNIKIKDIASYIGIDRSYLSKHFKKNTGMSPQQFLLDLRMKKAASLLKNTTLQVNEISVQVGYVNPLTFSKSFKTHFGKSPKTYRNEMEKIILSDKKNK